MSVLHPADKVQRLCHTMKGLNPPPPPYRFACVNSSQPSIEGLFQDRCPLFCEYRVPCPCASRSSAVRPLRSKCMCPSPGGLKQMGIQASENDSEGRKTIRQIERAALRQTEWTKKKNKSKTECSSYQQPILSCQGTGNWFSKSCRHIQ